MFVSAIAGPLFADLNDVLRSNGFISSTAFGVKKSQNLLQGFGISRVAEEGTLAAHQNEIFVAQLVEVVGQSGTGDVEFRLYFANDHAVGVRGEQELHDSQPGFRSHRGKHIGEFGDLFGVPFIGVHYISIIAEIRSDVKCFGREGHRRAEEGREEGFSAKTYREGALEVGPKGSGKSDCMDLRE